MRPIPPRGNLVLVATVAAFVAFAAAACVQFPDDPIDPGPSADAWVSPWEEDSGGSMKLIKPIADGAVGLDGGAPKLDTWSPPDTRPPTFDFGGPPPSSNSGKICTPPYGCVTKVEECLPLGMSSSKGMCLGKCSAPGSSCPVASPGTQFAACALQASPTELYCVYFCAVQGQTFACPDTVNYSCEAPDPTQPSVKVCVPK
jgi:hypothetical protein